MPAQAYTPVHAAHLLFLDSHAQDARATRPVPNRRAADHENITAIYKAVGGAKSEPIVRLLLAHGADVSHANNMGQLPIHFASQMGLTGIVRLLLGEHKARGLPVDPLRSEHMGHTPAHFAAGAQGLGWFAVNRWLLRSRVGSVQGCYGLRPCPAVDSASTQLGPLPMRTAH